MLVSACIGGGVLYMLKDFNPNEHVERIIERFMPCIENVSNSIAYSIMWGTRFLTIFGIVACLLNMMVGWSVGLCQGRDRFEKILGVLSLSVSWIFVFLAIGALFQLAHGTKPWPFLYNAVEDGSKKDGSKKHGLSPSHAPPTPPPISPWHLPPMPPPLPPAKGASSVSKKDSSAKSSLDWSCAKAMEEAGSCLGRSIMDIAQEEARRRSRMETPR